MYVAKCLLQGHFCIKTVTKCEYVIITEICIMAKCDIPCVMEISD